MYKKNDIYIQAVASLYEEESKKEKQKIENEKRKK